MEKAEKLFNMVYRWGRCNVKVDSTAPAYRKLLEEIIGGKKKEVVECAACKIKGPKDSEPYGFVKFEGGKYLCERCLEKN